MSFKNSMQKTAEDFLRIKKQKLEDDQAPPAEVELNLKEKRAPKGPRLGNKKEFKPWKGK